MKHSDLLPWHLPKTNGNFCLQNKFHENIYRKINHNMKKNSKDEPSERNQTCQIPKNESLVKGINA